MRRGVGRSCHTGDLYDRKGQGKRRRNIDCARERIHHRSNADRCPGGTLLNSPRLPVCSRACFWLAASRLAHAHALVHELAHTTQLFNIESSS